MKNMKYLAIGVCLILGAGRGAAIAQTPISACGVISQPGSYKVTQNLTAAGHCLILMGPANFNTEIDLAGFTLTGNGTGGGIVNNILDDTVTEGLTVRNGTIKSFDRGISIFGRNVTIEGVTLLHNVTFGLTAVEDVRIKDSSLDRNGIGAQVNEGAVVTGSTFSFNTSDGLVVTAVGDNPGSIISNNIAINNGGAGLRVTCPGNILGNTANGNTGGNLVTVGDGCNSEHNVAP